MSKLPRKQQQQYLIAKAITEGETRIQKGIGTYARAVQELAQSAREEFKGNRYALLGSRGGSGSSKSEREYTSKMQLPALGQETISTTTSMKELQAELARYKKALSEATTAVDAGTAQAGIDRVQQQIDAQPLALKAGVDTETAAAAMQTMTDLRDTIQAQLNDKAVLLKVDVSAAGVPETIRDSKKMAKNWQAAGTAIQQVGAAMSSIEDPAAKVAGTIAQAIASIALGAGQAIGQAGNGSAGGPWGWIAFAIAATATMATTIAQVKQATKGGFAEGGIVPGNSFSGDNLSTANYGINSGELILNMAQQDRLAGLLTRDTADGPGAGGRSYITGEQIVTVVNAYGRRTGRGEILR